MEQALLLALIVVVGIHIWQNFGGEVATVADDGAHSVERTHNGGQGGGHGQGHGHGWGQGSGGGQGHRYPLTPT